MLENKIRKFVLRKGLLPGSPFLFSYFLDTGFYISLFVYIILRIIKIPITHDEAGTILSFSTQSVYDIISYRDPIPNNHILNTLLIKLFTGILGYNEISCRLPNLIGFVFYLVASIKISYKLFEHNLFRLPFLILLIANPYVIEFFGLARGYGLSVGFMQLSIYYFIIRNTNKSLLFAALGVYANLTQLNFFFPLLLTILIYKWSHDQKKVNQYKELIVIPVFLMLLLIIPIIRMIKTNQFQYWGNSGFLNETFYPLLKSSIQGEGYFSQNTIAVFVSIIVLVILFTGMLFLKKIIDATWKNSISFYIGLLFMGSVLYNLLQHFIFKIPYLNARTSIFYYPLFVLAVSSIFSEIKNKKLRTMTLILYCMTAIFGLLHISRTYNLHSSYEWWFDGDNKKVIARIQDSNKSQNKLTFKTNWLFQPSLTFYIKAKEIKTISPPPYNKFIDTTEIVDYYYITSDDLNDWLNQNYSIDTSFAWNSRYLMKKKP